MRNINAAIPSASINFNFSKLTVSSSLRSSTTETGQRLSVDGWPKADLIELIYDTDTCHLIGLIYAAKRTLNKHGSRIVRLFCQP